MSSDPKIAAKAAEEAKIKQAIPHLKAIIIGLNNLGDNPSPEQIKTIQQAYFSLDELAESADRFSDIVNKALEKLDMEAMENMDARFKLVFNDNNARDITVPKGSYTFHPVEIDPTKINKFFYFDNYQLQDNEVVYICYRDEEGYSSVAYKMKSPVGDRKYYNFRRSERDDIEEEVFNEIKAQFHNEALVFDFQQKTSQYHTRLREIFLLAKAKKELKIAIQNKDSKNIACLAETGVTLTNEAITVLDSNGLTALHHAATNAMRSAASVLVQSGADVNVKDNQGQTPLHCAAAAGAIDVLEILIAEGADVNAKDNNDLKPLHHACKNKKLDAGLTLLEMGAELINIDVTSKDPVGGLTLLHLAAKNGQINAMGVLISAGAKIDVVDNQGLTPLHHAAAAGKVEVIEALVEIDAKIDVVDNRGLTPLHHAAAAGKVEVIEALVEIDAKIDVVDNQGLTPLHHAAANGQEEVMICLIKYAAQVDTENFAVALKINKALTMVLLNKKPAEHNAPIIQQMKILQKQMEKAEKSKEVKPEILAKTLNAVNLELKNYVDYSCNGGYLQGQLFKPHHTAGSLNALIKRSKEATFSPGQKVAYYALISIGVIAAVGLGVGLGLATFGVAPAVLGVVGAAITPIVSSYIAAAAMGLVAGISTAVGMKLGTTPKVLDTAGESAKVINRQGKAIQKVVDGSWVEVDEPSRGCFARLTNFFMPKQSSNSKAERREATKLQEKNSVEPQSPEGFINVPLPKEGPVYGGY